MPTLSATKTETVARSVTLGTAAFFIVAGAVTVFFEIKPFWLDEWFLIDNLKFKSAWELWGRLDHVQQFPRLYLQLLDWFAASLDYSYAALRLPSFLVHTLGILVCYRLSARLFSDRRLDRYLWVLIFISFKTSIQYFVQVKQYTMEMALGVVGLWQLLSLLETAKGNRKNPWAYALLCASFVVVPFFSYTYPIVVAPAIAVVLGLEVLGNKRLPRPRVLIPVFLATASIAAFYLIDARQVLQDSGMQNYWQGFMMSNGFKMGLLKHVFVLFFNLGTGALFGTVLGLLGISGWVFATARAVRLFGTPGDDCKAPFVLYSVLLTWMMVGLFLAGKLPLGSDRLNAFATPALGILALFGVHRLRQFEILRKVMPAATMFLILGVAGNIYVATIRELTSTVHEQQLSIYRNVAAGIETARTENLPILATPQIAYPFADQVQGDWVLKTHPKYRKSEMLLVCPVNDERAALRALRDLAAPKAVLINGDKFKIIGVE
jgi:hypothetical protein